MLFQSNQSSIYTFNRELYRFFTFNEEKKTPPKHMRTGLSNMLTSKRELEYITVHVFVQLYRCNGTKKNVCCMRLLTTKKKMQFI